MNATEVQHQTFTKMHDSTRQGWGGTFEQLNLDSAVNRL